MSQIRTRFAPSPTGYLHVGGLRTALYNYLFASKHNGQFILRIEDTDQNRYIPGSVENLIKSLHWAGLEYDEGPEKIEGKYGPYYQSQRLEIYKMYAKKMLNDKNAYPCFCSSAELSEMKEKQIQMKQPPRYNGKCRRLSVEEVQKKMELGLPHVIRMKIKHARGAYVVDDMIRGKVEFKPQQIDDQVIMKSDGYPTYHLASVIDDHLMEITHVIRGEEWLPSTPKHLQLYYFLGWEPPKFAHLPLLLNPDRSKLSKRQGDVATEDFRNKGFLSESLVNFIALLGWNTSDNQEIFSLDEMKKIFDLDRVGKAGAVFDIKKLLWMNKQYIQKLPLDQLKHRLEPYVQESFKKINPVKQSHIVSLVQSSLETLEDIQSRLDLFLQTEIKIENEDLLNIIQSSESQEIYKSFLAQAKDETDWNEATILKLMKKVQKTTGFKGKALWIPMRVAVTLSDQGPELPPVCVIFGKEKTLAMLARAIV